jgi:hypothetical protein
MPYPGVVIPSELLASRYGSYGAAQASPVSQSSVPYETISIPGPGGGLIQAFVPSMATMPTTVPEAAVGTRPKSIPKIDPYAEMVKVVPQFPQVSDAAWNAARAQLNAEVSPATQRLIQNKAAALGVELGLPSWNMAAEQTLANLLRTGEEQVQAGITNYQNLCNLPKD